jgi:hypothetical protein
MKIKAFSDEPNINKTKKAELANFIGLPVALYARPDRWYIVENCDNRFSYVYTLSDHYLEDFYSTENHQPQQVIYQDIISRIRNRKNRHRIVTEVLLDELVYPFVIVSALPFDITKAVPNCDVAPIPAVVNSSTNTAGIPARSDVIEAETEEESAEISDKIKDADDDFNYILSGIEQLDTVQANEVLNRLHKSLQEFISDIANQLA